MDPSPSAEATGCATAQDPPSVLWTTQVHRHLHNSLPLLYNMRQINLPPVTGLVGLVQNSEELGNSVS
jgi:hypothetical protein